MDSDPNGFNAWTFSTVRCWGERARGVYRLVIRDVGDEPLQMGILQQWQLTLYGSMWSPVDIKDRQSLLESAMSGKYLHDGFTLPCPPGLKIPEEDGYTITPNTLKTLVLVGCFSVFWTIYYMLEVCLSQRNKASTHGCRKGCCPWAPRRQNSKDAGTALESMPLCSSKDLDGVDSEHGDCTTASSFLAPELDCPPHQPPDLLQGKSGQIC